jgi:hypothetical protein
MRLFTQNSIAIFCSMSLLIAGCKKSSDRNIADDPIRPASIHGYGLNQMRPEEWAGVPAFSASVLRNNRQSAGLTYNGTLPNSYLLVSPQIRDQGQIGSCTGFCGAETDEMLYYYKNNNITGTAISSSLTTANGLATAVSNQIPNASAAYSPLFLYYVERVVINKGSIGSDPGANMVNIGQALQGLSNNAGTGTALTYSGYTFAGIANESLYPYPFVAGSGGYNVATSSTSPYTTPPYAYYSYGATSIPVYPNNFTIGVQSGGTTSSNGTTSQGYYVINSTQSQLVSDVKTAIASNKPVMMGFNVYDRFPNYPYFESLNTSKYTYNPLNTNGRLALGVRLMGGHAVPIIGYINDQSQPGGGVFICENSWGTPWGYHGYFYLPYSVLESTTVVPSGSLYVAII